VNADLLDPGEPLSPELVLVLPPELRAQALARLGDPVWPKPRPRPRPTPLPRLPDVPAPVEAPLVRSLGVALGARVVQLVTIFVAVTIVILTMSAIAHAMR
jgi:hypothetical protein